MKRLYKSRTDKKVAGVCGGIARYFDIDPTIIRVIWAILFFACGTGLLAYIIAAIVMSEEPADYVNGENYSKGYMDGYKDARHDADSEQNRNDQ